MEMGRHKKSKGLRAVIIIAHLSTTVKVLILYAYFKICIKQNIFKKTIIAEVKERKEILIFRDLQKAYMS